MPSAGGGIKRLVVVGAGGHGREIYDVAQSLNVKFRIEFVDDGSVDMDRMGRLGLVYSGSLNAVAECDAASYIVGIGDGRIRKHIAGRVPKAWFPATLVDSRAFIGSDVAISDGAVVLPMATVAASSSVGAHSHIGRGAAVGHDVSMGDFVSVFPLASISGDVRIGECSTIGSGAVVRQGLVLGEGCFVGAGAVVVRDVPAGATVVGNPARPLD